MPQLLKHWLPFVIFVSLTLLVDQLAKQWIITNFAVGESQALLPPFLQITRSINTGIAFGIGSGGSTIFLVLSVIIVVGLVIFYAQTEPTARMQHIALGLVVGGALGNVIDRLRFGHVVDFVHITLPNVISNVSNFADHFIVIGVGLMLLDSILQSQRERRQQQEALTT